MKARIINLMMLMMTMFIMSACNNEEGVNIDGDDFSSIMNEKNLLSDGIEIFELDSKKSTAKCPDEDFHIGKLHYCFENESELEGLYTLDDAKLSKWNNRTLVMVDIFFPMYLETFTTKVYEKGGKYVIEFMEIEHSGFRECATDHECYGILLDKANVKAKDIQLKVGIYNPAGTDSEGNRHEEYYEYLE